MGGEMKPRESGDWHMTPFLGPHPHRIAPKKKPASHCHVQRPGYSLSVYTTAMVAHADWPSIRRASPQPGYLDAGPFDLSTTTRDNRAALEIVYTESVACKIVVMWRTPSGFQIIGSSLGLQIKSE